MPSRKTTEPSSVSRSQRTGKPPATETTPAQEWGERIETGKTIARAGRKSGHVAGATEQPTDPPPQEARTDGEATS